MLFFHDRVAVVTGAGAGLGRSYALLLGERGAQVVVNDLGGSRSGDGSSTNAADAVVSEIRAKGGIAVPDYNSVVEGHKIIKTALDNFGRIDILINNAGILRDKSFQNMSVSEWDIIQDVHLKGAFVTTQAAWSQFRLQKYGRVIFTSSNAGLFGNFGQANYSAAKMGLIGLSNTLAIEGRKYNINVNVIVPTAASRLTEDILPPDIFEQLKPELIAPVVIWLCHEGCGETGSIIESAAGWAGKCSLGRSNGSLLRISITDTVTPETVESRWEEVTNMDCVKFMSSIQEVTFDLMGTLENLTRLNTYQDLDENDSFPVIVSELALKLYALGIGASVKNPSDLKYLYENHCDFAAFPTYGFIPAQVALMYYPALLDSIPNTTFDFSEVLHGEQYLEMFKVFPTGGKVFVKPKLVDVLDKGRNAVIVIGATTYDENKEAICYNETALVVLGKGGFGGKNKSDQATPLGQIMTGTSHVICSENTSESQGALYRLSGDSNPLHIDPDFARLVGHEKPILHGLCTLAFSARHVLARYAGNNPDYFKAIKARFVKPFIPGGKLYTLMWREGNRIHFQTESIRFQTESFTKETLISGAYIDLSVVIDNPLPAGGSIITEFDQSSDDVQLFKSVETMATPLEKIDISCYVYENTCADSSDKQSTSLDGTKKAEDILMQTLYKNKL